MPPVNKAESDADLYEVKTSLAVLKSDVAHISRAVDEVRESMRSGLVTKTEMTSLEARVASVESTLTWITRTVVGLIITSALAALYLKGGGK